MTVRRTRQLLLALSVVLAIAAAPANADNGPLRRAIAALRQNRVYVDPGAQIKLGTPEATALESQIANDDPGRIFVALLPASERAAAGGSVARVGEALERGVGKPGIYAIIVGTRLEAGSHVLARGQAAGIATQTLIAHRDQGPYTVLSSFVTAAAQADPQAPSQSRGNSNAGLVIAAVIGGVLVLLTLLFTSRVLRRRKRRRERMAEVRRLAREDQIALGDDIRDLDINISMPNADPGAKEDYGRALECYDEAGKALERAGTLGDLATVPAKLEEGRWLMESARARLAGKPPPERRAPCFFDPRHGPSVEDLDWAPEGGSVRSIPVCAADATRIKDGQEPMARQIVLRGRRVPYWQAPAYYGPYAGGYYGDYGGTALLTGFALGSVVDQHEHGGGDSGTA